MFCLVNKTNGGWLWVVGMGFSVT